MNGRATVPDDVFVRPLRVSRATSAYAVHSYHTKVPPEAIRPYVEHYTKSGGLVLDPFAGSGMTGLAAGLAGRQAILSDLSPAAVHIAGNYTAPCDPEAYRRGVDRLLRWAEPQIEPLSATVTGRRTRGWADRRHRRHPSEAIPSSSRPTPHVNSRLAIQPDITLAAPRSGMGSVAITTEA